MNQYNLPPIAQDLAPRMNMLANDIYHNTKKGFDPSGGGHIPTAFALESERNLIDKFQMPISAGMIQSNMGQALTQSPVAPLPYKQELQ